MEQKSNCRQTTATPPLRLVKVAATLVGIEIKRAVVVEEGESGPRCAVVLVKAWTTACLDLHRASPGPVALVFFILYIHVVM
jgi:hypothetical protein